MEPVFAWDSAKPDGPPADEIQERFAAALSVANSRKLNPEKLVVRLTLDKSLTNIEGLGYDQDAKLLFICKCELGRNTPTYNCRYSNESDLNQR